MFNKTFSDDTNLTFTLPDGFINLDDINHKLSKNFFNVFEKVNIVGHSGYYKHSPIATAKYTYCISSFSWQFKDVVLKLHESVNFKHNAFTYKYYSLTANSINQLCEYFSESFKNVPNDSVDNYLEYCGFLETLLIYLTRIMNELNNLILPTNRNGESVIIEDFNNTSVPISIFNILPFVLRNIENHGVSFLNFVKGLMSEMLEDDLVPWYPLMCAEPLRRISEIPNLCFLPNGLIRQMIEY